MQMSEFLNIPCVVCFYIPQDSVTFSLHLSHNYVYRPNTFVIQNALIHDSQYNNNIIIDFINFNTGYINNFSFFYMYEEKNVIQEILKKKKNKSKIYNCVIFHTVLLSQAQ